jgi:hypothetical protein
VQSVSPFGQRLPLDRNVVAELDGRVLVRPGAPDFAERHDSAPDLSSIHQRPVIIDLDVGESDTLLDDRMLTHVRHVKVGMRGGSQGEKGESEGRKPRGNTFHILLLDALELKQFNRNAS